MNIGRSAWAEIKIDNLKHNLSEIVRVKPKNTKIMAVVKANAYGHGAVQIARALKEEGVDLFAVALVSEALELRRSGISEDIMILGYTPHELFREAIENDIILTVYDVIAVKKMAEIAEELDKTAKVHIKIDSGMGRLGFRITAKSLEDIVFIDSLERVEIDGFFTHFATSDETDKTYSALQYETFMTTLSELEKRGIKIKNRHISNSAAIIDLPLYRLDIIRPGIMLYGYYPSENVSKTDIKLKPVMTLKSKISNIKCIEKGESVGYGRTYIAPRKTKVGTVPIGYGDGFTRLLSKKIDLTVNENKVKLIGNICMDQSMIDCTDADNIKIGDEVVIFGDKKEYNSADDLAKALGTINYEILCMIGMRVPRVYIYKGKIMEIKDYML